MGRPALIGAIVAAAIILGAFALLFAQGAPTQPIVSNSTPLSPSAGQGMSVEFEFGFSSIVAPNTVWGPGLHVIYSAVESSSAGGTPVTLANNITVAPNIQAAAGTFYTMFATVNIDTVSLCSGAACAGVIENVTITAKANVVTPYVAWFSPVTVATFTSTQTGCVVGNPCPAASGNVPNQSVHATSTTSATFYAEILFPLGLLIGFGSVLGFAVAGKFPWLILVGIAGFALAGAQTVTFGWL
jgi:hypothetical protein